MIPDTRVRRAPGAVAEAVGDEVVVWLRTDRTLHLLDATGALVWTCLDGTMTATTLARTVSDRVRGDPAQVRDDVLDFLASMAERSLILTV